jgi:hypothetical protein
VCLGKAAFCAGQGGACRPSSSGALVPPRSWARGSWRTELTRPLRARWPRRRWRL